MSGEVTHVMKCSATRPVELLAEEIPGGWRSNVKVMEAADAIGLSPTNGELSGTIDQEKVLDALNGLAEDDQENSDLFAAAAERVPHTRSAGVEELPAGSVSTRPNEAVTTQLRYRSEMADIFTDLAIDVGLRQHSTLAPAL